ncbi:AMP-binding enzyme [Aspergillus lucknowensis]|uniref:AMP-binding enzyme n=1 Tax=Aspergillus lucknowensis TaxID=176173 RepID=A0ABR4M7L2_9EURO
MVIDMCRTTLWPLLQSASEDKAGSPCYTIHQITTLIKRIGCGLYKLNARGKRVMVYGAANIHFPLAVLGVIASGAACNMLAPGPAEDLVSRLRQLECDIVLFAPGDGHVVAAAAAVLWIPGERQFVVDDSLRGDGFASNLDGARHWRCLLDNPGGDAYEWPTLSPNDAKSTTAILLYTSGTTGASKLAERKHYGLIGNVEQTLHHYTLRRRESEIVFCNYKFFGMGFLILGILIPLKARYKTIFPAGSDAEGITRTIERFRPTWVMAPKYLMRETLALPTRPNLDSVRHLLTGGAIIPCELIDQWQLSFGSQVQSTYGMTEAGFFTIPDPDEPVNDATTGVLLPSVEAKPVRHEGYLNGPEHTAQTIVEDGWIKTGDIGWVDEFGRFYIVGRQKDLFKVRGDKVTAAEIETAIIRHPEIKDVAVIPVTLPGDGEPVPRGYVVKIEESNLTVDNLISWMQHNLPDRMQLSGGVAFIEAIPISSVGNSKVDRQKLSEIAARTIASKNQ